MSGRKSGVRERGLVEIVHEEVRSIGEIIPSIRVLVQFTKTFLKSF